MPDVSRTDIGRRMFQLQKEKAVEQVIEKIRQNIGSEWKTLPTADVHLLERLLQAAWVNTDKVAWERRSGLTSAQKRMSSGSCSFAWSSCLTRLMCL